MDEAARAMLAASGWAEATAAPLAGDASARRYLRLTRADGACAILMLAPQDGSTERFVKIAAQLRACGLSAPAILAEEAGAGRLLLEDFGDDSLAARVAADPGAEPALYAVAVELLAAMQADAAPAWLPRPDASMLAEMTAPAAEWYAGGGPARPDAARALAEALRAPLDAVVAEARPVLVHRDFHAENLMWLPARAGAARLGLLDFQDAIAGPGAYDLVSLTRDARRDLAPGLHETLLAHYAAATGRDVDAVTREAAVLGVQRNLRILGVFARLSLRDGKARYVDLIPRVWRHLQADLAHPALAPVRDAVLCHLPAPDRAHLDRLKGPCAVPLSP